ncbi:MULTISPECIES: hypothetical protein [Burkholderia cepacia complex]|uniref:hypothetical protein n=1 Tax=Burkholderia cepacia complex TaxID=87882 RepID=UPI0012BA5EBB|nr:MULTISPECIES: hypothetical protein [Burkholderia cepacia complex]
MNSLNLEHRISQSGEHFLVLTVPDGAFIMGPENVEALMAALAEYRTIMLPAVSGTAPTGMLDALIDPLCRMTPDSLFGGAVLQIRHPGLGWLTIRLPSDSLRELSRISRVVMEADSAAAALSAH